jgi:CYTH domain-containing protein
MTTGEEPMNQDREIERQFLLRRPAAEIVAEAGRDRTLLMTYDIWQSYLPLTGDWTIRVRKTSHLPRALPSYEQTLKRTVEGIERVEVPINLDQAGYERLLRQCGPTLHKRRSEIALGDRIWEVDVFLNPELLGLELAEVELPARDAEVDLPAWVGEETSHLPEFRNAVIVQRLDPAAREI